MTSSATKLSPAQLFQALGKLSKQEQLVFVNGYQMLQKTFPKPTTLPENFERETALLACILDDFSEVEKLEYARLRDLARQGDLSIGDESALEKWIARMEQQRLGKLQALQELATLRGIPLMQLIQDLNFMPTDA